MDPIIKARVHNHVTIRMERTAEIYVWEEEEEEGGLVVVWWRVNSGEWG